MKNLIKAKIITHSKRLNTNEELITYKLIYPRIIHSELMTYSMMSVNSASSRAIPVNKLIEVIEKTPFYPISYQKKHSGMQGTDYFTSEEDIKTCLCHWHIDSPKFFCQSTHLLISLSPRYIEP